MTKFPTVLVQIFFIFLGIKALGNPDANPAIFSDPNCQVVEAKRKELIDWNVRIAKAGVDTFNTFPKVEKSEVGCKINLNQFIPKVISQKNYPGFNSESETNCHGSTKFFSGLSSRLERAISFSPATYFRNICQEILSPQDLRAGDIGLVQQKNSLWTGTVETDNDVHSFTFLSKGAVLQSPNMEVGKYPEIASLQSPIDQYVTQGKNPELNPNCQAPGTDKNKCQIWIRYYRCDFAQPSCFESIPKRMRNLSIDLDRVTALNKTTCAKCEAENAQNRCSMETKVLQSQSQTIRDVAEQIRGFNSWEQLANFALKPLDPEIMNTIRRINEIEQIQDPIEKRALALAVLDIESLRKAIASKVTDLEKQNKPRPTTFGRDIERLSSGISFSADQPKDPKFSSDTLLCLHLKLSKSDAKFPMDNCKQVFDSIGL